MSFVRFDKEGRLIDKEGNCVHLVGVNYVTSYVCTNFWEDWRPEVIDKDLQNIAKLGWNAVRIPMHWGYMEPEEGKYNPEFEWKFVAFVEMCRKYDIYVMPWFLVGIATGMYDVPFRNGRSFFEEEMIRIAENHLKHFIEPYKDEEMILFWDICDEPEWYSELPGADKLPYTPEIVTKWVKRVYDAILSVDKNHLVTLGFGHIGTENYGMDVRDMADILDLMVVTAYPQAANEGLDTCRNNYTVSYHVKMNSRNKPVFTCEAPGMSSILYSDEMLGRYFKVSLYSNLVNGSTGVLPWVYQDFEESLWQKAPLNKKLLEPSFGVVTEDGHLKPSGKELVDFAKFVKEYEIGKYRPQKAEVGVLVPAGYYQSIRSSYRRVYTSYVLAKGCSVDADLVWSSEDISKYKLLLVSSTDGLTTEDWDKIRKYVENGGRICHMFENNSLNIYFNRLFGVEVQTIEENHEYLQMNVRQSFGHWIPGDAIAFNESKSGNVLRVKPKEAEVLCTFHDGEPALLRSYYGKGTCYLMTAPIDQMLLKVPYRKFLEAEAFAFVDFMVDDAGIERPIRVCHPAVEVGCLVKCESGEKLFFCINHDNRAVDADMIIEDHKQRIALEPAGVVIYKKYDGHMEQIGINLC